MGGQGKGKGGCVCVFFFFFSLWFLPSSIFFVISSFRVTPRGIVCYMLCAKINRSDGEKKSPRPPLSPAPTNTHTRHIHAHPHDDDDKLCW